MPAAIPGRSRCLAELNERGVQVSGGRERLESRRTDSEIVEPQAAPERLLSVLAPGRFNERGAPMNNTVHDDTAAVIAAVEEILNGNQPASPGLDESHDDGLLPLTDDGGGSGGGTC